MPLFSNHFLKLLYKSLLVLSIVGGVYWLFLGAYFTFPNAEDLSISIKPQRNAGMLYSIIDTMLTYDGRYFTNFLHAVNPLVFNWIEGYKWMPVIGFIFVSSSLIFLIKSLFSQFKYSKIIPYSILSIIVWLAVAPSIPHLLYWMISSFVFFYPWGFVFFWIGGMVRYYRARSFSFKKNSWFTFSSLCLICSLGMNEMFLSLNTVVLLIFLYLFVAKNRTKEYLPFLIIGFACIYLFISAPGIQHRSASFETNRDLSYFLNTIKLLNFHFVEATYQWLFKNWLIIPLVILLNMSFIYSYRFSYKKVLYIILLSIVVMVSMTFPYYYGMGIYTYFPARIYNTLIPLFITFLVAFFYLLFFYIAPYLYFIFKNINREFVKLSLALSMFLFLFFGNNNISNIRKEYHQGLFHNYKKQTQNRLDIIKQAKEDSEMFDVVTLDPFYTTPKTIYYIPDILPNREFPFWNETYEKYFNLYEVRLKGDTTEVKFIFNFNQFKENE